jgi:hypothetical protein
MYNTILPYVPQIYVLGVGMILSSYIYVCACVSLLAINYHDFLVLFAHTN